MTAASGLQPLQAYDKMRSGADLGGASPLVSFHHVIDPHFVAFFSSLYTTICNLKPNPNLQWSLIRR